MPTGGRGRGRCVALQGFVDLPGMSRMGKRVSQVPAITFIHRSRLSAPGRSGCSGPYLALRRDALTGSDVTRGDCWRPVNAQCLSANELPAAPQLVPSGSGLPPRPANHLAEITL